MWGLARGSEREWQWCYPPLPALRDVLLRCDRADSWASRWLKSSWKVASGEAGEWKHTAGKWFGDAEAGKGLQTGPDSKFHTIYTELPAAVDNTGKDLVLQVSHTRVP